MLDDKALDSAARKIWDSESHPLMKRAGHSVDWETLDSTVKKSVIRKARLAITEYLNLTKQD
jgi:hypothetical protein